jgi:hypothetical protein
MEQAISSDRHSMAISESDATVLHAVHRTAFSLPRDPNRRNETKPSESQVSLQRALRTLRAVRQRSETGRNAHPDTRYYSVHVVVDPGDIAWISAAIEAVEKAIAAGAAEAAGPAGSRAAA